MCAPRERRRQKKTTPWEGRKRGKKRKETFSQGGERGGSKINSYAIREKRTPIRHRGDRGGERKLKTSTFVNSDQKTKSFAEGKLQKKKQKKKKKFFV